MTVDAKRKLIETTPNLSIQKQCELLMLPKSTLYYQPCQDSAFNLLAMNEIDKLYTAYPYYGKRRMSIKLKKMEIDVGVDLARTLMKKMGLEAIGQNLI